MIPLVTLLEIGCFWNYQTFINNSIRKSDFFGRLGAEEFLIIAPSINAENSTSQAPFYPY